MLIEVSFPADTTLEHGFRFTALPDYMVGLRLTREQAEELFTDLFIKLTDKSEDEGSK